MISFSFFTLLLQNAPRLERNPSRVAIDNIARLTGRNHWPVKRKTPEEWETMKPKTKNQKMQIFVWQKEDSQGVENA